MTNFDLSSELHDPHVRLAYRGGYMSSYGQWSDASNPYNKSEQKLLYDMWQSGYEDGIRELAINPPKQERVLKRNQVGAE